MLAKIPKVDQSGEADGYVAVQTAEIICLEQWGTSDIIRMHLKGGEEILCKKTEVDAVLVPSGIVATSVPYRTKAGNEIGKIWFYTGGVEILALAGYTRKKQATNLVDPEYSLVRVYLINGVSFYADKVEWEDYLIALGVLGSYT
jgi:hypothetical protein